MLFNSLIFFIFLPIVFGGYWLLKERKWQNVWLLLASYVFYGWWDWRFLFLIAACSGINFWAGQYIAKTEESWKRRIALSACVAVCIGALCAFKYYNFFAESLCAMFGWDPTSITFRIVLPVGISFFTFQALSYTIDIALGKLKPTKSWVEFFTFIAFFPQLVAGPIERASNLLPQFQKDRRFDFNAAAHGLSLMAYGLFKKMVVADTLASYIDVVYLHPNAYPSLTCIIAAVFFSIQIYCDFSGYSDVARGVARLFGFELMVNFNRPYLSTSVGDFWRNWHISLSTWFKDYVYIPLGGNRVTMVKWIRNTMIVFLLSGLWHGAAWTFVAWGALHGIFLVVEGLMRRIHKQAEGLFARVLGIVTTDILVCLAWIFFRARSFEDARSVFAAIFTSCTDLTTTRLFATLGPVSFLFSLIAIGLLFLSYATPRDCRFKTLRSHWLFTVVCIAAILIFGAPVGGEFIYFQF